jgi:hypothetical protein
MVDKRLAIGLLVQAMDEVPSYRDLRVAKNFQVEPISVAK